MPDPTREEAIEILETAHRELAEIVESRAPEEVERPGGIGDEWSLKDLAGHITTWEEIALAALENWRAGAAGRFSDLFATIADIDRFNDKEIERKHLIPWVEISGSFAEVHARLIDEINRLTDEEWAEKRQTGERTTRLGGLISRILGAPDSPFGHTRAHLKELSLRS